MNDAEQSQVADRLVLTVDEVADALRISRSLAFAGVRNGTIPHIRIGRRILIPRGALTALLRLDGAASRSEPPPS